MSALETKHVLLGVTGSIAAYKAATLVRELRAAGATVRALPTRAGQQFLPALTLEALTGRPCLTSALEMDDGRIPHVEEAYAADLAIVAPATADCIAKLAAGIGDEALYTTLLSYDGPLIIAPAMETNMWRHAATQANVQTLRARGAVIVEPAEGALASGRSGPGRLAELSAILDAARSALADEPATAARDLVGRRVLVTAGPTVEDLDPVRFLSNRSSGRMGVALARRAARRGAEVVLVHGPMQVPAPDGARSVPVRSAQQMHDAVVGAVNGGVDVAILAAAVADWRPAHVADQKRKKGASTTLTLELERTPDILAALGGRERRPLLVGFAAETNDVEANARDKLRRKGCDLICANDVSGEMGFGSEENAVRVFFKDGTSRELRRASKDVIADGILDAVVGQLADGSGDE
jgi:phosphopantothenoylcysteine decarboxylase/phosphopantothenate--cysteine ligase